MALIKCPECEKEVSDKAEICPHCGYPLTGWDDEKQQDEKTLKECPECRYANTSENTSCTNCGYPFKSSATDNITLEQNNYYQSQANSINNTRFSTPKLRVSLLGIISLILSLFGCVFVFSLLLGIILAIIDLKREKNVNKTCAGIALIISGLWIVFSMLFNFSSKDDKKSISTTTSKSEVTVESTITQENGVSSQVDAAISEDSIEIFETDLLNSWSDYVGKKVTVSYPCGRCQEDDKCINSKYNVEAGYYIRSYVDNYRQFEHDEYVTVTGIVDGKYASYIEIKNAHIDYFGENSVSAYNAGKSTYEEKQRLKAAEYESVFKEESVEVTYEELERYPDTYKETKIKVVVKILEVEPDGIIFEGNIKGSLSGKDVALYDRRDIKEPKLLEGDTITIYGYGSGLTTVKLQDTSGIINKTVDTYNIPSIDIKYIEFK